MGNLSNSSASTSTSIASSSSITNASSASVITSSTSSSFSKVSAFSKSATVLCHCCGTEINHDIEDIEKPCKNPLVTSGLIPESLASILMPPTCVEKKQKSKKIVTEARVITGDGMIEKLNSKRETERKKEEEKENRKVQREQKKEQKRLEKVEKQKDRDRKKAEREDKKKEKEQRKRERQSRGTVRRPRRRTEELIDDDDDDVDNYDDDDDDDSEMEVNTTVHCVACGMLEPEGNCDIDWYQCDRCNGWAHQSCVDINDNEDFVCDACFVEE